MQSVVWTFVKRMIDRTEKKIWDFLERTMKSKKENSVWKVWQAHEESSNHSL